MVSLAFLLKLMEIIEKKIIKFCFYCARLLAMPRGCLYTNFGEFWTYSWVHFGVNTLNWWSG